VNWGDELVAFVRHDAGERWDQADALAVLGASIERRCCPPAVRETPPSGCRTRPLGVRWAALAAAQGEGKRVRANLRG
jgi:hypothetical protein